MMTGSETTNTHTACDELTALIFRGDENLKVSYLKRPEECETNDVSLVVLKLFVSSNFHYPVEEVR
jgi:hypothetical protein